MPNGLEAVMCSEDFVSTFNHLARKGVTVEEIIKYERSLALITQWLYLWPQEQTLPNSLFNSIASKIFELKNLSECGKCLKQLFERSPDAVRKWWTTLDMESLGTDLVTTDDLIGANLFLKHVKDSDEDMAGEIFWDIDRSFLAGQFEAKQTVVDKFLLLGMLNVANMTVAEEVCPKLDPEILAEALDHEKDDPSSIDLLELIASLDRQLLAAMRDHFETKLFIDLSGFYLKS
jgi:hypothetical protein